MRLMKRLKIVFLSVLSLVLMFLSTQRTFLISMTAANLFALVCQANTYAPPKATDDEVKASATQPMNNTAFGQMNSVGGALESSIGRGGRTKGLQFHTPVLASGLEYRSTHDTTLGGFTGNEYSGDIAVDADIYDGLIAGVLYQHTHRGAWNAQDTSERLDADGVSLYFGKRLFDCLNLGVSYNHGETEDRLTRSLNTNLDRTSDGYTLLAGVSNKHGKWNWATTLSFGYVNDDYDQQQTLQTGRFGWGGSLGYDITKQFTLGAAFTYYNYVFQDTFNNIAPRDDDYYDIGPRLSYYLNDRTTLKLDFDSQQGYTDFGAYTLRASFDLAF